MKRLVCMPAVAILVAACATPLTPREQGAVTGAAIGMGIGAVAGSASGHAGAGAVIGGVSGAVVGGVIGDAAQQRQADARAPAPAPVVVTPPPVVVTGTPTWILVPGTAVYYSPEIQVDVYLHGGVWYYRVNGVWFIGPSHVGPWERTPVTAVPVMVTRIPPGWRVKHGPPAVKHGYRKRGDD